MATEESWLEERKKSITGSDIAPILGLSHWTTKTQVFREKTGLDKYDDDGKLKSQESIVNEKFKNDYNPQFQYGHDREPFILSQVEQFLAGKCFGNQENEMKTHRKYPFLKATIDGFTSNNELLEFKTYNINIRKPWKEVPIEYFWQVCHYLMVLGWRECFICPEYYRISKSKGPTGPDDVEYVNEFKKPYDPLIGRSYFSAERLGFDIWSIRPSQRCFDFLLQKELDFWEEVQTQNLKIDINLIDKEFYGCCERRYSDVY
jgi:putative phage-type endonuclease